MTVSELFDDEEWMPAPHAAGFTDITSHVSKDGRIARIGNLKRHSARHVLGAGGLIVAPGAIDLHTHYDAQIHWDPYCTIDAQEYNSIPPGATYFESLPAHRDWRIGN